MRLWFTTEPPFVMPDRHGDSRSTLAEIRAAIETIHGVRAARVTDEPGCLFVSVLVDALHGWIEDAIRMSLYWTLPAGVRWRGEMIVIDGNNRTVTAAVIEPV
jgi:hypothetical protein